MPPTPRRRHRDAIDLVRELTRGVMADAVVVSPAMIGEDDVGTALALTRKGGTCVLTGLPSPRRDSIAVALQEFILMNKTLCGTVFGSCNPKSDIPLLAALYESGRLLLDEMITRRYRLDDINDAYADLAAGELIRGVIDFGIGLQAVVDESSPAGAAARCARAYSSSVYGHWVTMRPVGERK